MKYIKKIMISILVLFMVLNIGIGAKQNVFAVDDVTTSEIHDIFVAKDNSKLEKFKAKVLNRLLYHDSEIDVSDIDIDPNDIKYTVGTTELTGVFAAREIVRKNPFHSTTSTVGFPEFTYKDNGCVRTVKYTYHPAWTEDFIKKVIASYDEVMALIKPGDSDFAKIIKIHDWIVKNVSYGMTKLYFDFAVGALANRSAVCAGYAQCYEFLLSQVGVESIYIAANTVKEPHAWNLVKLDGHWFHVDCTWDRGLGMNPNVNHTYFMLNDEEFNADGVHSEDWKDPAKGYPRNNLCSIKNKFYKDNKTMVSDKQINANPIQLNHQYPDNEQYSQSDTEHWKTCYAGVEVHEKHDGNPCVICGYKKDVKKQITITFDSQNGAQPFTQLISQDDKAKEPTIPNRDGFIFKGWYTSSVGGEKVDFNSKTFDSDTVLYAQWEKQFTIQYDWGKEVPQGVALPVNNNHYTTYEEAVRSIDQAYTKDMTIEGSKDQKEGIWTFSGWNLETLNDNVIIAKGAWNFKEKQDTNVSKIVIPNIEGKEGMPIGVITPILENGKPGGSWKAENLPDGLSIDEKTGIISGVPKNSGIFNNIKITYTDSDNHIITGVIEKVIILKKENIKSYYTVDFKTNGGNAISSITREENTTIELSHYIPTREGYIFDGWYTDTLFKNKVDRIVLHSDMTLYAKWVDQQINKTDKIDQKQQSPKTGDSVSGRGVIISFFISSIIILFLGFFIKRKQGNCEEN